MKIALLIDKKSNFQEPFLEKVEFIANLLESTKEVSVIRGSWASSATSQGIGIDASSLVSEIELDASVREHDSYIYVTKAKIIGNKYSGGSLQLLSFHTLKNIEGASISDIYIHSSGIFSSIATEVEDAFLQGCVEDPKSLPKDPRSFLPLKDAVLVIHGMNTYAEWEKRLFAYLNTQDIRVDTGSYGHFLGVISPGKRKNIRNKIYSAYDNFISTYPKNEYRHTVIAHSYGTYGFFDYLDKHSTDILPDTMIFTAPIVQSNHKLWEKIAGKGTRIFIEVAKRDWVVKAAPLLHLFFAELAGTSGFRGSKGGCAVHDLLMSEEEFLDEISKADHARPINIIYSGKSHSDFFTPDHWEKRWLAIIKSR